MPLRARVGDEEVVSLDVTPEVFNGFRGRRDLTMVCCDAPAVAKRSVKGLPFFAHGGRGTCSAAEETAFHLQGKALIARAAREAGWHTDVEVAGQTPAGERWRADVLCRRANVQVVFELQRSGITLATLRERQARYAASGVRAMWFMRTHERALAQPQPWQVQTPALYVTAEHQVPLLSLSLGAAVQAALGGHLALFPRPGRAVQVTVVALVKRCYHFACRGDHHGILQAVLVSPPDLPELAVVIPGTTPGLSAWVDSVVALEHKDGWKRFVEWSTRVHRTYTCPGCGGLGMTERFKPNRAKWVRLAQPFAGEPASRWHFQQGEDGVMCLRTVLTDVQWTWLMRTVGGQWVLKSLTE